MKTAKLIWLLLWCLAIAGCVSKSDADQREADARSQGFNNGFQQGRSQGYTAGYEKGRGEVQAPVFEAQQDGREQGYRDGWNAGNDAGYKRGWTAGHEQGFRDAHPGRAPHANPAVDSSFRVFSLLGGASLIAAMIAFCAILIWRSNHVGIIVGKSLAVILGAAATYILYMTMGFGDAVPDALLSPAPSNLLVYSFIVIVGILTYFVFAAARWLLRIVSTEKMEAICIAGVSAAAMAIIILLTRILAVTPSFADYLVSSILAGMLLGTLTYVMFWIIDWAVRSVRVSNGP